MDDSGLESRVFVVCGKSVEADVLSEAFAPFGNIQSVKVVRDKGVAYVKYDKASSAAAAIEALHECVLNEGRGPMLKVMIAEAPTRRTGPGRAGTEPQLAPDPDNVPPRSRLFMVVPKTADAHAIEEEMAKYRDLEYCKVDLIASKGIVFCKYVKSSSALLALEAIIANDNLVAGYKVKCMIAEPKGKRGRVDAQNGDVLQAAQQLPALDYASLAAASFMPQTPLGPQLRFLPPSPSHSGNTFAPSSLDSRTASGTLGNGSSLTAGGLTPPPAAGTPSSHHNPGVHSGSGSTIGGGMGGLGYLGQPGSSLHARLSSAAAGGGGSVGLGGLSGMGINNGYLFDRNGLQDHGAMSNAIGGIGSLGLNHLQTLAAHLGAANLAQGLGGLGGYGMAMGGGTPGGRGSLGSSLTTPLPQEQPDLGAVAGGPGGRLGRAGSECGAGALTRLYVVCAKSVSEDVLACLFRAFPGLEYCDLKRDHVTGQPRGFCYVKYSTPESAADAIEHLNGIEFPPNSNLRLKVMYAEPIAARNGASTGKTTPPSGAPSRSLSVRSDSNSSILQHRSLPAGEEVSIAGLGSAESMSESREHRVEVAAVQNSLAHMSMPHQHQAQQQAHASQQQQQQQHPVQGGHMHDGAFDPSSHPVKAGRRTLLASPPGAEEAEQVAESAGTLPTPVPVPDERTLFTLLSRPMPSYALEHVFAKYGPLEWVQLRSDERYGIVRFCAPESARAALEALNGTEILGEALTVTTTDPAASARNTKRPRVAE